MNQIEIEKGECVNAEILWEDESGPVDLTGMELSIVEACPSSLTGGQFVATDAINGEGLLSIDQPLASDLRMGRSNWVRLQIKPPGGCPDVTPQIWIAVI